MLQMRIELFVVVVVVEGLKDLPFHRAVHLCQSQ
jgi:hypothetical protein